MSVIVMDLDEYTVNNKKRLAVATNADGSINWTRFFNGELILELDEVIPEALARLKELAAAGHTIWYLTSREAAPAEAATRQWLEREGYPFAENAICRPARHRTVEFKAREVERLHREVGPVIFFGDNSEKNLEAVRALSIEGLVCSEVLP